MAVSERIAWTAKDHCENEARTQDVSVQSGEHHPMPKDNGYGELPEELGQEALDNYIQMVRKKASWIT